MITFRDGPAAGQTLMLKRTPLLLRVVQSKRGEWDALDQLDDVPRAGETITVYRIHPETVSRYHVRACRRSGSGFYFRGEYSLFAKQPTDEEARSTAAWQAWATEHAEPISKECRELAAARGVE